MNILSFCLVTVIVVLVSALFRSWWRAEARERLRASLEDALGLEEQRRGNAEAALKEARERRWPVPSALATALEEEAFCAAWRQVRVDDPFYLAVRMLVAREIVAQIDRVSDPRLAGKPGELAHAAGGLEWAVTLAGNLEAARRKPEGWCMGEEQKVRRKGTGKMTNEE